MTGLFPGAHGVRDNGGFKLAPAGDPGRVLKAHGWATGGFIAAYVLDHRWGIARASTATSTTSTSRSTRR